jgi:hypothetical protein
MIASVPLAVALVLDRPQHEPEAAIAHETVEQVEFLDANFDLVVAVVVAAVDGGDQHPHECWASGRTEPAPRVH